MAEVKDNLRSVPISDHTESDLLVCVFYKHLSCY